MNILMHIHLSEYTYLEGVLCMYLGTCVHVHIVDVFTAKKN